MTQQCPFTCNRCTGSNSNPTSANQACFDRTGADGTSNCASVAYLCQNGLYRELMKSQCPKTCRYC
nr:Bm1591 [Brugia malayi]